MTYDEIIEQGRARALDFGADWPSATSVLYRRIQVRQQEIFSTANRVNPDYFGVNVRAGLDTNGDVDLKLLEDQTYAADPAASITRVEIFNPGTHPTLVRGDLVTIIPHNDPDAGLTPRMTLRNQVLHAYCSDLDGVDSICVYYGYRPKNNPSPMDGTEVSELPDVYQELHVVDLVMWMVRQTISMDPETKTAVLGILQAEEDRMMERFMAEVADYAGAQVSRFGSVVGGQRT